MITLFTPYFKARSTHRQRELDECLRRNLDLPLIDRVVLLVDDGAEPPVASRKLQVHALDQRPSYRDWLELTEKEAPGTCAILANSDIYFDGSLEQLPELLCGADCLLALSRWERGAVTPERHPNPHWSQDTWAVRSRPDYPDALKQRLDIRLGVPRCDNKVAYVFATAGWRLKNPIDLVRSYHVQASAERSYDKRGDTTILGGVAYVHPTPDMESDARLDFDIWTLGDPRVDRLSVNRSLERWRQQRQQANDAEAPQAASGPVNGAPARGLGKLDLFRHGERICNEPATGFAVYRGADALLVQRGLDPADWVVLAREDLGSEVLAQHFPDLFHGVLGRHLTSVSDRPRDEHDMAFWQFPCITEKQACDNHLARPAAAAQPEPGLLHAYLPLPWATWIDHRTFPDPIIDPVRRELGAAAGIVRATGGSLRVHTVCQHIRWRLMLEQAADLGVTDLWISHCTREAQSEVDAMGLGMRLHPWSLYAVNHCDPDRSEGLEPGKPMRERRWLASFIGAHMSHYLSDIRVRLHQELSALGRDDVLVDLGELWHFNKTVYDHQVQREQLDPAHLDEQHQSAVRYNRVLSDSRFSLCPQGAGPNTLRFWESIAVGSIPVRFGDPLVLPRRHANELDALCINWTGPSLGAELVDHLAGFSDDELQARSDRLREIYADIEQMTCF